MGTKIFSLVPSKEIELKELSGKKIAVDAHMYLYQFLTTIRQRDGTLLKDSNGNVTSHLVGLFSRTAKLLEHNIKPCFVFDGKAPDLKKKERERRKSIKIEAKKKYETAMKKEDIESMKKYASMTRRVAWNLLRPFVPSEDSMEGKRLQESRLDTYLLRRPRVQREHGSKIESTTAFEDDHHQP